MSASASNSSKSTTRESAHKRKKSEEVDDQRTAKKPFTPQSAIVDVRDTQRKEAEDGSGPGVSALPLQTSPILSEPCSVDRRDEDTQNEGARKDGNLDGPIPTNARHITEEPYCISHGDNIARGEEAPSMSFFQGSSNFQINNANVSAIGGNATIIQFGDGQFTNVQRNLICDYIANLTILPNIDDHVKKHVLTQSIISLPRAEAVFNDYQTKKKSGPCFEGTRVALLREMADWATGSDESRMYVLSGLAGIGKSTVAYTIASRAAKLNLLGASFFFSRDEADRNNAKKFFSTIAYQLCIYNETFAKAIGDVLLTQRGSAATTKGAQEQLQSLILDPLRNIIHSRARPILVVVDALDECNEEDEHAVVTGLSQLVRLLPSFRVILTTRPQPLANYLFWNHDGHRIFYLQDIEDKVVDSDIRLYLKHSFSREQVRARLLNPRPGGGWCASDGDIESLVKVAGRLFIIASVAVLYVLNKTLGDPSARMKKLLSEIAQDRTPFHALNRFYSIIIQSAVQVDDDDDDIVERYQTIVGTIVVIQTPLPVTTLVFLIGEESEKIYAMLQNLQSVILLGADDVPRIYHKSFPDYLTDPTRCKDTHLLIDPKIRHTHIAIRCFELMNKHLRYNILGLGNLARFMRNEDGLKEDGITDEQVQERIPKQLHYACVYWANHIEVANVEDTGLMNGLERFADEHMLHWFEVLSLVGKLDLAHRAINVVLKLLPTSLGLHQLISDALRFISKFYEVIERSALHTYYSALPFTPTDSLLYRRYIKEAVHNICTIEGGPEQWNALVANLSHGECVKLIKFSVDGALFVSCSEESTEYNMQGNLKIWDAATGTPVSTITGYRFAVANDCSTVASSEDNVITYYNTNGNARSTIFATSMTIQELALSSESSRVAAGLSDGTVWLWDSKNGESINNFEGFESSEYPLRLQFSPVGTRLIYSSANDIVKLGDGVSGRFIADLRCESKHELCLAFSGDGSRIAFLSYNCWLRLWNSESGVLIGAIEDDVGRHGLAISADGSLLATADSDNVELWSKIDDSGSLVQIEVLEELSPLSFMAFSLDNTLVITTEDGIKLYNFATHSFISTFPFHGSSQAEQLALSPDRTRLVVGDPGGSLYLWDSRSIDASTLPPKSASVKVLALSQDCLQLACGFDGGSIELWGTISKKRRIASMVHQKLVSLQFRPDSELFVSGSYDGTIKLWNSKDGSLRGNLNVPRKLYSVALSNSMLVATWDHNVTLWNFDTLSPIHTLELSGSKVAIAENSALIAINDTVDKCVRLFDVVNQTTITSFDVPGHPYLITRMGFLPDNSQIMARCDTGAFLSLDIINKRTTEGPILAHLIQLPDIPLWHGIPIWHCQDKGQRYFSALFSQHKSLVPMLWIPRDLPVDVYYQGSSMIALGCEDGRIILLRLLP